MHAKALLSLKLAFILKLFYLLEALYKQEHSATHPQTDIFNGAKGQLIGFGLQTANSATNHFYLPFWVRRDTDFFRNVGSLHPVMT